MSEIENSSFIENLRKIADQKKLFDIENNLYNSVDPQTRQYLSALSSQLLEADVYKEYKESPIKIEEIINNLTSLGVEPAKIDAILRAYRLTDPEKDQKGLNHFPKEI